MIRARSAPVALLALLVALLAGCGIPTDGEPRPLADEATPPAADPQPELGDTTAQVYLVNNDERLVPRPRALEGAKTPVTVLEALLLPTSEEEEADGLQTQIPALTTIVGVTEEDGILAVDLSAEWGELLVPDALYAYAQVVLTLTELPGVEGVRFLVEGQPVDAAPTVNETPTEVVEAEDYATLEAG
ncbi:GerMN domain-containing protein [Iamia sp. SCSIO 61187]|uniref:GerMN domain-containing protein n=1 Tax=Iamia sp. SCSIO 61187 TaxID=2722752 RepID=UPI001C63B4F1|nr:GerMN domain-containing protein [Iamia sp. SCSIO 61187]QYG92771.1 GerMN domain-containing protein [Iamia sp. SCSIO 61187]